MMLGVFLVVVVVAYVVLTSGPGKYDDFAKCLSQKDVKMYGAFWCPHCKEQKAEFGSSVQYLPYVECSTPDGQGQLQVCIDAGIKSYPTWDFNGKKETGVFTLAELSQKTSCPLS